MVSVYRSVPSGALVDGSLSLIPRDGSLISRACRTHRTKFSLQVIEPRNLRKRARSDKNTPATAAPFLYAIRPGRTDMTDVRIRLKPHN